MIGRVGDIEPVRMESVRGGKCGVLFRYAMNFSDAATDESAFQMVAHLQMDPGGSIGEHLHTDDAEIYAIVEGEGVYTEDGEEHEVSAGDMCVLQPGHTHGLRNTGAGPLIFFAIVAEKS